MSLASTLQMLITPHPSGDRLQKSRRCSISPGWGGGSKTMLADKPYVIKILGWEKSRTQRHKYVFVISVCVLDTPVCPH